MSGFTGITHSPLATLLGIKTGSKVSIINPPPGFVTKLNPLPDGVEFLITAQSGPFPGSPSNNVVFEQVVEKS